MKWISVKERLPELNKNVIVYCFDPVHNSTYNDIKEDFIRIACLIEFEDNSERIRRWHGHGSSHSSVTHWMPLPEIPNDDV